MQAGPPSAARAGWPGLALALLAGLAQAASIASPWNGEPQPVLQVASLAVLAWLLRRAASPARAFFTGWLFATAWLCATFWWLFISMHTYGGMAAPLAAFAVLALAAALSLYYALAGAAFVWARPARGGQALLFASLWLLAELLRGHWFTGFPWGAGGYAHTDGPLARLAPLLGVYGIGWVAAWLAFVLASLAADARGMVARPLKAGPLKAGPLLAPLAAVALLAGSSWLAHADRKDADDTASAGTLEVALLQGNIPQNEKFQAGTGVPLALAWYAEQLARTTAPLVVAPETALPLLPQALPAGYWDAINAPFLAAAASASGRPRAALIGMPLADGQGYANAAVGLRPGAPPYRYDKHHLVPFGEFVPLFFRWFTNLMEIPLGDFSRGGATQPPLEWQGQRLLPNICYEDLFGEEIAAHFAPGLPEPTILVNLSNIGWFGDSSAIDQHLQISRMRALEFDRPMLRATNTGATAIIDHRARVLQMLPRHTRGVLVGEVRGRTGRTPYAAWVAAAGLWPLWALGLLPLVLAAALRRRR